ncbi:MAG: L-serine ammonia-lyase, iron-sulfur-dependent, subunit alpha [Anaeroplasmataceae bacterium]
MNTIKELFKIGNGPSSSHTMGPKRACLDFLDKCKDKTVTNYEVILYGSLALTGKGHLTDYIIYETLPKNITKVVFDINTTKQHPNTLIFKALNNNVLVNEITYISVGGGSIVIEGEKCNPSLNIYTLSTFNCVKDYCLKHNKRIYDYVYETEDVKDFLKDILKVMLDTVDRGINTTGTLHGELKVKRKSNELYLKAQSLKDTSSKEKALICAYAYAVSEENASGGLVVTSPTCGASGVLPAVVKYYYDKNIYSIDQFINALATSALIGNLIKTNASISGAEAGCQAEVGTASSMAAAFICELHDLSIDNIEQASEIALEHHLGLTCDPILGYVQIPCIERNAVAALRSIDAFFLASLLDSKDSKITLDTVIKTMYETGKDLKHHYRETSEGGLAKHYKCK